MRKTYKFLKKYLYIILTLILAVAIFGIISFSFMCDDNGGVLSLRFPHVVTILFFLTILGAIGVSIFACVKAEEINVKRIKKNDKFLMFASILCAIMMFIFFIYECVVSITKANFQLYFFFRVSKWLLTIPSCAYFILQALPKKIKHKKLEFPSWLKITLSVCVILWSVFGVLVTYFGGLNQSDVSKITQLFVYASISIFFVFEGEFENIKPKTMPYMISAFITAIICLAFPLGISIAKVLGQMSPYRAFSQPELLLAVVLGIYALAKMFALVSTMHTIIESSSRDGHSRKFDKKTTAPAPTEQATQDPAVAEQATENVASSEQDTQGDVVASEETANSNSSEGK